MTQALTLARPYARAAFGIARDEAAAASGGYAGWSQALGFAAQVAADPRVAGLLGDPRLGDAAAVELLAPPQGPASFGRYLAMLADNRRLALLPEIAGLYEELRAEAERVVKATVTSASELPAAELSYGQRKLLEFAALLMSRPKLVLLDEPTAGVNPVMIETMERHIRARHREGVTFLIVEHDMQLVMRLCDPVIVLDRGSAIAVGAPADIQVNPIVLDAYLGD